MLEDATAIDASIREIQQLLVLPDQLAKVSQLKTDFSRKKLATETQLGTIIQTQVEEARQGLDILGKCLEIIVNIQRNFKTIDDMCRDAQNLIQNYPIVREVAISRKNLETTLQDLKDIFYVSDEGAIGRRPAPRGKRTLEPFFPDAKTIPEQVRDLEKLLSEEDDFTKAESNLLRIHARIQDLERCRDTALYHIQGQPQEAKILEQHLSPVSTLCGKLENVLWLHIDSALSLAQNNASRLLVVMRVIERQEKIDAYVKKKGEKENRAVSADMCKGWQGACLDRLQRSLHARFDATILSIPDSDVDGMLEAAESLIDDLTLVMDQLAPCFPPHYNIFNLYTLWSHHEFVTVFRDFSVRAKDVPPKDILRLLEWAHYYHERLEGLGVTEETLQPVLTEELHPLMDGYFAQLLELMKSWAANMLRVDATATPEPNDKGQFFTPLPLDLFRMVNEQVDILKTHSRSDQFLLGALDACKGVLIDVQNTLHRTVQEKGGSMEPEYLAAQINNMSRCLDYLTELQESVLSVLAEERHGDVNLDQVIDGFVSVSKTASRFLVDSMFADMLPAFQRLFSQSWYEEDIMASIVATLSDYFQDFSTGLVDRFFRKIAVECLERVVQLYVEAMLNTKVPMANIDLVVSTMERDANRVAQLFSLYARQKVVEAQLQVLEQLRLLLESLSSAEMVAVDYRNILHAYPDCSLAVIERLLALRPDMDKKTKAAVLDTCRTVTANLSETSPAPQESEQLPNQRLFTRALDAADTRSKKKDKDKEKDKEKEKSKSEKKKKKDVDKTKDKPPDDT